MCKVGKVPRRRNPVRVSITTAASLELTKKAFVSPHVSGQRQRQHQWCLWNLYLKTSYSSSHTLTRFNMELNTASNMSLTGVLFRPNDPLKMPSFAWLLPLILYPLVCALLRHRRLRATLETYPYATSRRSFATMTTSDAFRIQQLISELEFPFTYEKGLQFALFRTYGIPSISKLLVQTTQLSNKATATKRYADTTVLIIDFTAYPPGGDRATEALARMNYIHGLYIKSGKISNDDLLYTLSLFTWEPVRWINRHEWRQVEDFERCAFGTFWKSVGDAMRIDYCVLKSGSEGWVDGLQWMEELAEWAEEYEKAHMEPQLDNFMTAEETVAVLLYPVPSWGKAFGKQVVTVLMDERLRKAIMYEKPPQWLVTLTLLILDLRKYTLRYLSPPRPSFMRVRGTTDSPSKDGTFFLITQENAPWYIKPTLWNRFGPSTWIARLMGLPLPGDEGGRYSPQGYKIPEVGPDNLKGKGMEFMKGEKEWVGKVRSGGCPFNRVKIE